MNDNPRCFLFESTAPGFYSVSHDIRRARAFLIKMKSVAKLNVGHVESFHEAPGLLVEFVRLHALVVDGSSSFASAA
jgi:hypothetical protein